MGRDPAWKLTTATVAPAGGPPEPRTSSVIRAHQADSGYVAGPEQGEGVSDRRMTPHLDGPGRGQAAGRIQDLPSVSGVDPAAQFSPD
jgi:hypothetical protein